MELSFEQNLAAVRCLGRSYNNYYDRTRGKAGEDIRPAGVGNGLEECRIFKGWYVRRTLLKQVICMTTAGHVGEVELNIRHLEDIVRRYEGMSVVGGHVATRSESHSVDQCVLQGIA